MMKILRLYRDEKSEVAKNKGYQFIVSGILSGVAPSGRAAPGKLGHEKSNV